MAADGGTAAEGAGFRLCGFEGHGCVIPPGLAEPPAAERFAVLPPQVPERAATTRAEYAALFRRCGEALAAGRVSKVVLARTEDVPRKACFSPYAAFEAAAAARPEAFTALVHTPQFGTWLVSTPELLLRYGGGVAATMALAGTRPRCGGAWDAKNEAEQALVADYVRGVLQRHGGRVEEEPRCTLPSGEIEHLCTRFRCTADAAGAAALAAALPPTPAVSGFPVAEARRVLAELRDADRGLYAGFMGPWGADDAALFVVLRCMRVYSGVCRLYAGGGIMPDSAEETEWRETVSKMEAMRAVLETVQS